MVEKDGDAETKSNLQPPFYVREIDSKCSKGYRPLVKKDKEDANREHRDNTSSKDKEKAKSHNPSIANQPQAFKKRQENRQGSLPATGVNATKVAKKDKDKAKDLSHVEFYTCKQKRYYASRCPEKPRNYWRSRQLLRR